MIKVWLTRIIHSKTMWLSTVGAGLVAFEASFAILQPMLPVNVYATIAVGLSVVGAVLRALTTKPLSEK